MAELEDKIKQDALQLGFDACGIAQIVPIEQEMNELHQWLNRGYGADLRYMEQHIEMRANPCELLPSARSMIMVLLNYYPREFQPVDAPHIAAYAYGNDYHYIVKSKLSRLVEQIKEYANTDKIGATPSEAEYLVFCDSAPVMERTWAVRAGLGWIGKSNMLINPTLGTFTFIGTLITSLELESDTPIASRCGRCTACIDNCPTQALIGAYHLDARKCLSYHTIESRAEVPQFDTTRANHTLYGCDACQLACPWNRFAQPHHTDELRPIEGIFNIEWSELTRSEFKKRFKFSPMQRAGYQKIRNRAKQIKQCI